MCNMDAILKWLDDPEFKDDLPPTKPKLIRQIAGDWSHFEAIPNEIATQTPKYSTYTIGHSNQPKKHITKRMQFVF